MSTQLEKFGTTLEKVINNFKRREFQPSLDACSLSHLSTEEELAKGFPPDYSVRARISDEEIQKAKTVGQKVGYQRVIAEVIDKLW